MRLRFILATAFISCSFLIYAQNSNSLGNVFIHSEGNMTEFGELEFNIMNMGTQPGIIGGERVPVKGYFNFAPDAGWTSAEDYKFIDGYVRYFGNAPFVFPIGDNNKFRPAAISGGSYVEAAYYGVNPTTAVTSDIRGGDFPVLPQSGPFNSNLFQDEVTKVSEWEYWDINGTDPTILTLTWDADSNVDLITNNDLERLTIVGWNGSEWEPIPSEIDLRMLDPQDYAANFNGSTPSLPEGSISTKTSVIPSEYEVYTLAGSCINIDIETERSHVLCLGDELNLSANSYDDATITWSNNQTGTNITVAPTQTTNYTVTARLGGCEISKDVLVEVRDIFVDLGQDTFVCRGQELMIVPEGTPNGFYQWDDGSTVRFGDTISVNLNSPRDIQVTITDAFGCESEDEIFVDVRDAPDVDTGRDRKACRGDTVFLQARGSMDGMGYRWSTGDTLDFIWVSPSETTTYEVSLTENGCTDVSFARVEIFPEAFIEIMNDPIICGTEEVMIETSGSEGFYQWNTGEREPNIMVTPEHGDTYSVTITNEGNCQWEDEITFEVYDGADLGDDMNICLGQEVNISVLGNYDNIVWENGMTDSTRNVTPTNTTTYSITTTFNGCEGTDEITVSVGEELDVNLGEDLNVCKGDVVTLSTDAAGQYYWSNGMNTSSITVVPFITTTYSVTVYSGSCEATDEITVFVDEDAAFVDIITDPVICPGGLVRLEAEGTPGAYRWSTGQSGQTINVSGIEGDTYSVTVTGQNGCEFTDEITFISFAEGAIELGEDIDICVGESFSLEVPGDWDDVQWSNGSTEDFITVAPLNTTSYSVTVTKDNCESTDDITVNVVSNLELDLGEDITICAGETIELGDSSVSGDFDWNTGQTSSQISVSPMTTTTYTATVRSGNCESVDEITVNVEEIFVEIEAEDVFCEGETVTLQAIGSSGTYEWSTGVTNSQISIVPQEDVVYSVTVTSPTGCQAVDEFTFSAFNNANVSLGDDIEICNGAEVTLELSGLYDSAVWNDGTQGGTNSVSPASTTTYTVTASLGGCEVTDQITVNVVSQLNLDLGNDIVICNGQEAEISGNVGGNYEWSSGQSTESITVSPTQTTTYTANVTSGTCSAQDEVTVIVEDLAFVNIEGNTAICSGQEVTLSATGSTGTYEWNTGETSSSITFRPIPGDTYSVTLTTSTGCTASDEITFESFEAESIDLGPDIQVCTGGRATLEVTGTFDSVEWSDGSTTNAIEVSPTQTTTYSVTATYGNCEVTDFVTVEVVSALNLDLGNDITICNGQEVEIVSNAGGVHQWSTGDSGTSIVVSPTQTTTYSLKVFSSSCSDEDEVTVFVENNAFVEIVSDTVFCPGEQITLEAEGTPGMYTWNTGATGQSVTFTPSDNTTYSVTVTSANGCEFSDEVLVQSFESNYIDLGEDISVCTGQEVELSLDGTFENISWSNGQTGSSITVNPTSTTTYTVTASYNGCEATDEIEVVVGSTLDLDLGEDITVCAGQGIELGSNIAGDYEWSTGQRTSKIEVTPTETTTYSVTVTSGTCSAQDEITINVEGVQTEIMGSDVLCEGGSVDLWATGPGNATYRWSTGDVEKSVTIDALPNISYRVTVTTPNGCSSEDEIIFTEYGNGSVDIGSDLTICAGESVWLTPTGTFDEVEWSTGEMTNSIQVSPTQTTTYTMTAIYQSCSTEEEITVNVASDIDVDLGSDIVICPGQSVELSELSVFGDFEWTTGQNTRVITVSPTETTTYGLTVESGNCSDSDEVTVIVQDDCTADLYLEKTVDNFSPQVGDIITFQILVGNSSTTVDATNVHVSENVRSGFRYRSHNTTNGVFDFNTSSWYIDIVPAGETQILEIEVEVLNSGDHSNIAEIIGADQQDEDSDPDNGDEDEDDQDKIEIEVTGMVQDNTSEIGDLVWKDENGNGVQDGSELGVADVTVHLYRASNINAPFKTEVTDLLGYYRFTNLSSGDYFVEFVLPEGMVETKANVTGTGGGSIEDIDSDIENTFGPGSTRIINLGIDEQLDIIDGGIYNGGQIGDLVWFDALGGISNRYDDMIDSGMEGVPMHLLNLEGDTLATSVTDESGRYLFDELQAGMYIVEIELDSDMKLVNPKDAAEDVDSDFNVLSRQSIVISLEPGESLLSIDAGVTLTLPLDLLDFWGNRDFDGQFNRLFWTTASEVNTYEFVIERSLENASDFEPIGQVEAAGNSSEKLYYTFDDTDSRDAGVYYYRLKSVDLDGSFTYSKIVTINVDATEEGDKPIPYKVFPIPTSDFVTLEINSPGDFEMHGFLVNNLGQNIRKIDKMNIGRGISTVRLDVQDIPQGEYYLNFYVGEKQFIARILKMD